MNIPQDVLNLIADYVNPYNSNPMNTDEILLDRCIDVKFIERREGEDAFEVNIHTDNDIIYFDYCLHIYTKPQFYSDQEQPQKYLRCNVDKDSVEVKIDEEGIMLSITAFADNEKCVINIGIFNMESFCIKLLSTKDQSFIMSKESAEFLISKIISTNVGFSETLYTYDDNKVINPPNFNDLYNVDSKTSAIISTPTIFNSCIFAEFNVLYEIIFATTNDDTREFIDTIYTKKKIVRAKPIKCRDDVEYKPAIYKAPGFVFIPSITETEVDMFCDNAEDNMINNYYENYTLDYYEEERLAAEGR